MTIEQRNIRLILGYFILSATFVATPIFYAFVTGRIPLTPTSACITAASWLLGTTLSLAILKPHKQQDNFTFSDAISWAITGPLPAAAYTLARIHLKIVPPPADLT